MRFPGSPILGPDVCGLIARIAGSTGGTDPSTSDEFINESSVGCEGRLGSEGEPSRPTGEVGPAPGRTLGCRSAVLYPFAAGPPRGALLPVLRVR
jgi:hypothetical protein